MQVLQSGEIFVPYVGHIRASGRSIEQVRLNILTALEPQTPNPQITLERVPGSGASISLLGAVTAQGVYPIEVDTMRLTAMLARAGGVAAPLEETVIRVDRGRTSGEARLSLIVADPVQDIALRPGDRITFIRDDRTITVLGATGGQTRIPVPRHDYRLIDLLGDAGGLNGNIANAKGVFVFRSTERGGVDTERLVIRFDLSTPAGIFAARTFRMRHADTVYVSEAPIRNAQKVIATVTGVATSADDVNAMGK
nr:polysaccharide biosynthesis/export family protein [Rhodobacter sp. SGA-6-6]